MIWVYGLGTMGAGVDLEWKVEEIGDGDIDEFLVMSI